ncbi:MAG TPA: hypothetical protein VHG08_15635 [Longimicrobium sp.]|nr:hypothetical protein [Longimicrobium sp.]
MHTEHLQNVRPSWVLFGWLVSVAVVAFLGLVLAAGGFADPDESVIGLWGVFALAAGFFAGGLVTGVRVGAAPILHGVAIGVVSLLVWFVVNVVFGEALDATTWNDGTPAFYAGALILQMAAAAVGARIGSRQQRAMTAGS